MGASFLGGAFVNGPGLQWAQTRLQRSLGLNQADEIALVDLKPVAILEEASSASSPNKPTADTSENAVGPTLSLQTESDSGKQDTSNQSLKRASQSSLIAGQPSSQGLQPSSSPPAQRSVPRDQPGGRSISKLDATITPVGGIPPTDPSHKFSQLKSNSTSAAIVSLPDLLPANSPSPAKPSLSSTSQALSRRSSVNGNDTWPILEHKMQSLGVARYTIDGEPGGRVVCSCLIPLAGRQAVTQRFEAEGDDIIHAVQAALRRIALWRASQPPARPDMGQRQA